MHMNDWKKFYETSLRKKENVYSNLNISLIQITVTQKEFGTTLQ